MKTPDSFTRMMHQISAEADAEHRAEIEAGLRKVRMEKIRRVSLLLVLLGLAVTAYLNRSVIDHQWQVVLTKTGINQSNEIAMKFGANLKEIQTTAAKRDSILGDLTGK